MTNSAKAARAAVGAAPLPRAIVLGIVLVLTLVVIVAPLGVIFVQAFSKGLWVYVNNILEPNTRYAIWLTIITALVVVPINVVFGIAAAWLVTKFDFPGRNLLAAVIELPYAISPIVAGVAYLFVYGAQGLLGPLLETYNIKIMFSIPAIWLVSLFVTAPFVARELIPLMQVQGSEEEEVALTLGASGLVTFIRVTLPSIRWALFYGAILCNARVMGEFGAVSVVSGTIRGVTNTLPLQIQLLYQDYNTVGAFGAATILTAVALLTIILKTVVESFSANETV
jgi:sulfate transport system permease protein